VADTPSEARANLLFREKQGPRPRSTVLIRSLLLKSFVKPAPQERYDEKIVPPSRLAAKILIKIIGILRFLITNISRAKSSRLPSLLSYWLQHHMAD
jgi:hypothetical protein